MKLTAVLPVLCVALLSQCTTAFFMGSRIKPEVPAVPVLTPALEAGAGALETGAGALAGAGAPAGELPVPSLNSFGPLMLLKLLLTNLGIPVHHLVEGSRKCVTELGPEAVGALKSLLGALTFLG
ncbi:secretoglobin family 3A member 1 isoform X1 [Phyllostomus hastatus]|uniref:secretoglobin family 3A member 1 isoform X1 n=1 Tax=Phyllostomus hastatus TaxID=9423 RepID=UPI001E67F352|nr:secretoglobin family 3A member 1 isoform X1 [Phyllostomus hastatus]